MKNFIEQVKSAEKKEQQFFIIVGSISTLVLIVLIWFMVVLGGKSIVLSAELNDPFNHFNQYIKGVRNYPSKERSEFLQKQNEELARIVHVLREEPYFLGEVIEENLLLTSPLKFKEKLFLIKSRLKAKARKNRVFFDGNIGFSAWEKKLPPDYKLKELSRMLSLVESILGLALDSKVTEVVKVEFKDVVENSFEHNKGKGIQYRHPIKIVLRGESDKIKSFLQGVWKKDQLFLIEKLNISKELIVPDDSDIAVEDDQNMFALDLDMVQILY